VPKLYVIRHGEPSLSGVFLGRTDPPLSEAGRRDAHARLARLAVSMVWCSPLRRARETAEAIDAPLAIVEELAEVAMGDWEGRNWREVERTHPAVAARKEKAWFEIEAPGGEPWSSVRDRVARALHRVRSGPFPAAVVAHGGVNAEICYQLTGRPPGGYRQGYCEVFEYEIGAGLGA
jgi:broad specificity phosphatase PhoE